MEISFRWEKSAQGINFIFTYSRLGWSLMNNAIEIGVRHLFLTWALFRGGVYLCWQYISSIIKWNSIVHLWVTKCMLLQASPAFKEAQNWWVCKWLKIRHNFIVQNVFVHKLRCFKFHIGWIYLFLFWMNSYIIQNTPNWYAVNSFNLGRKIWLLQKVLSFLNGLCNISSQKIQPSPNNK